MDDLDMGLLAGQHVHARYCDEPHRRHDRRKTHAWLARCSGWLAACLIFSAAAFAEPLRILTFHTNFDRKGPGVLAAELSQNAPELDQTLKRIVMAAPDIAVLQSFDYDRDLVAASLVQSRLKKLGLDLPDLFVRRPNTGVDTGFDLDRNGKLGEARDMQGYGRFAGQGGLVVLSKYPILHHESVDLSDQLWKDQPAVTLPTLENGEPYYSSEILEVLRLHSVAAWDVAVQTPKGKIRVLTSHATPPVFDGPEDRNGLRNAAEVQFWSDYIDDLKEPFIFAGNLNVAKIGGQGSKPPLRRLLSSEKLNDPWADGGKQTNTVEWENGLSLRVSYVLPSRHFGFATTQIQRAPFVDGGTRHHPVWVDLIWK